MYLELSENKRRCVRSRGSGDKWVGDDLMPTVISNGVYRPLSAARVDHQKCGQSPTVFRNRRASWNSWNSQNYFSSHRSIHRSSGRYAPKIRSINGVIVFH
jgi:hypothetical protein